MMTKSDDAIGTYDDGLFINFGSAKPSHITIKMATTTGEIESCDIRLTTQTETDTVYALASTTSTSLEETVEVVKEEETTEDQVDQEETTGEVTEESEEEEVVTVEEVTEGDQSEEVEVVEEVDSEDIESGDVETEEEDVIDELELAEEVEEEMTEYTMLEKTEWMDVLFYRFGYFNYQKLNLESMIYKFEADVWYQVDLVLDWDEQMVNVYVDQELSEQPAQMFFTKDTETIDSADTIIIYGLTPGSVSKFRDLQVCDTRCLGGEELEFVSAHGLSVSFIIVAIAMALSLDDRL